MPSENTMAIASALRRAILRLGKVPRVAYLDNGRAFSSKFFNGTDLAQSGIAGVFERLGIKTIFAWPYHGQSKTFERFFGTFAELERLAPTYVGTSIANKPPRMNRGERIHRALYERGIGSGSISLEQAHGAIAAWFDEYAMRPQQSGYLKGIRPLDVFEPGRGPGVDAADLTFLMMASESRTLNRNGVNIFGDNYWHRDLVGRTHQVIVRYDLQDKSCIHVYHADSGDFICEAWPMLKVHPAATALGTDQDREDLRAAIEEKRGVMADVTRSARDLLKNEILPATSEMLARQGLTPVANVRRLPAVTQPPVTATTVARIEAEADELLGGVAAPAEMPELDRYMRLAAAEALGAPLAPEDKTFMRVYEGSAEYAGNRDRIDEARMDALLAEG